MAFATVQDFLEQHPTCTEPASLIESRLAMAERFVKSRLREKRIDYSDPDEDFSGDLMDVTIAAAERTLSGGADALGVPSGVTQTSITGGAYSQSYTFSSPYGGIFLYEKEERRLFAGRARRIRSVMAEVGGRDA